MKNSRRVCIALVTDSQDNILMGCRNDNNKFTMPGGHAEKGEDPYEAMMREFKEETGLEVADLKLVDSHWDKERNLLLYLFKVTPELGDFDVSKDPDKEVNSWSYINPNYVVSDLHVPLEHNIALKYWMQN